jgi:hypothetical protein
MNELLQQVAVSASGTAPSVRRWFLSYNSQDLALIQTFEAALRRKDPGAHIFFAPKSLRAGGFWLPELAKEIAAATAFVLLVGDKRGRAMAGTGVLRGA